MFLVILENDSNQDHRKTSNENYMLKRRRAVLVILFVFKLKLDFDLEEESYSIY
jgi:hypothetical protein